MDAHANFPVSTVATAPSPAISGTSLVVGSGHGARFPAVPFNAIVAPVGVVFDPTNAEIIRVTARSTDTFSTIVRAQEGSSARTIVVGDQIFAGITAKVLTDMETVTIAASGDWPSSPVNGQVALVRAGSSPYNFVRMTYDGTYGKWVSDPILIANHTRSSSAFTASSSTYAVMDSIAPRTWIPNLKDLYDAGLRPQMRAGAQLTGTGTVTMGANIFCNNDGDNSLTVWSGNVDLISSVAPAARYTYGDWISMDPSTTPTKNHGFFLGEAKCSTSTATFDVCEWWFRWVK